MAYGKGRVFHTALGHDLDSMQAPGFLVSFARGTEWAARAAVTLPAKIDIHPKDPNAVRVLLVTGGHDHEASFYNLFEDSRKFKVTVNPHPIAFRRDLRKDYDVVVLYDSVQELPALMRRAYHALRSGKCGPVMVEIPNEVFEAEYKGELDYTPAPVPRTAPDPDAIRQAVRMLLAAQNPVL